MAINFEDLLRRYIKHVVVCEGTDYLNLFQCSAEELQFLNQAIDDDEAQ